jgi:two-component system, sensor histidine kinase ChiS
MTRPVLLIEDDPDIRMLAEMSLRLNGIEVVSCPDGTRGLAALEHHQFSLVILDVMMPDLSGYEVLSRIQDRWGDAAPPIALFSARPQDTMAKELEGRPNVHILAKPFEPDRLAQSVHALMRS